MVEKVNGHFQHSNIIAGSPPGERLFIYFEKVCLSKIKFLSKIDLKWLRSNKMLQKIIYSIFVFYLQNFLIFMFFLGLFLDEPAMVLRYVCRG